MIEVIECRFPASIQDTGRPGYRHLGVPLSGALDAVWLALANTLAGNDVAAAAIEVRLLGPSLRAHDPCIVALAGEFAATIIDASGQSRQAANWRGHALSPGETLVAGNLRSGIGYVAIAGGIDVPSVLGSRSTYARAGIGGMGGRNLAAGDLLMTGAAGHHAPRCLPAPPGVPHGPLRVLPGPHRSRFPDESWSTFLDAEFRVGREADRMGLRLDGPTMGHVGGADIVSEAVTPGAIQVPGDGRPIVLLADCQTVGGYAKIATVIGADLPRLAHLLPGQTLRFALVDMAAALAARREQSVALAKALASIGPAGPDMDLDALYNANLIDGVIDAD